jgi:hypothetical protein
VSDKAFIFMLVLGAAVQIGILIVAHVSSYRLKQRLQRRRQAGALAPEMASVVEPELDLGDVARFRDIKPVSVQIRHAETAR